MIKRIHPLVVLDDFYKLNCFFLNYFSPCCPGRGSFITVKLLSCIVCIVGFRNWQKCILRFVMRPLHVVCFGKQTESEGPLRRGARLEEIGQIGLKPAHGLLLWETKTVLKFFQRSLKIHYTLALLPHQSTPKPWF